MCSDRIFKKIWTLYPWYFADAITFYYFTLRLRIMLAVISILTRFVLTNFLIIHCRYEILGNLQFLCSSSFLCHRNILNTMDCCAGIFILISSEFLVKREFQSSTTLQPFFLPRALWIGVFCRKSLTANRLNSTYRQF